jgi:RNA polymerase sigma-70 factor (ECF subfamily)
MDLETAVAELAPQLLRYGLGRTGDAALAEEVAQDALAALVARWRRFGAPDCPAAFAFAVARRRAGRALLRRRLLAPLRPLREAASCQPGPEESAAARSELALVLAALRRLPGRDREALLLAGAGDLDTAAASAALGISPPAFKMRLHRARQRLKQLLEDRDGHP